MLEDLENQVLEIYQSCVGKNEVRKKISPWIISQQLRLYCHKFSLDEIEFHVLLAYKFK